MTDRDAAQLITEFRVPLHVRRHCAAVANFAIELGEKLIAAGEKINLDLLRHSALLHDFMRVVDFRIFSPEKFPDPASAEDVKFWKMLREKYAGRGHEEVAAQILEERGFSDVARVVLKHRFVQIKKGFDTWEEKILYYADKRVMHDKRVTLKERLEEGRKRNMPETIGTSEAHETEAKIFKLEREITRRL